MRHRDTSTSTVSPRITTLAGSSHSVRNAAPAAMARREILPATSSTDAREPRGGKLFPRFHAKLRGVQRHAGLEVLSGDHARGGDPYLDSRPDAEAVLAGVA